MYLKEDEMLKRGIAVLCCVVVSMGFVSCNTQDKTSDKLQDSTANSDNTKEEQGNDKKTKSSNTKVVLVDDEYVKIIYTGVKQTDDKLPVIELSIENKSDQNFSVQTENVSADNQMALVYFSEEPEPGKTIDAELEVEDINQAFQTLEGTFVLIDNNYDTIKSEPFQLSIDGTNPVQAQENALQESTQDANDEVVLAEDDYVKIVYKGLVSESDFATSGLNLTVENKSDQTIILVTDKFYLNEKEIESLLSMDRIAAKKSANGELGLYGDVSSSTIKGTFIVQDENRNTIATESVEVQVN